MAQANNVSTISPSRFHNLADLALAGALGHADAVLKSAEANSRTTCLLNPSVSPGPELSTSHSSARQAFPKKREPTTNRTVDSAGAPRTKRKSKMNMMVNTTEMTAVKLNAGSDLSSSAKPTLANLIAKMMATREAANAACTKLDEVEEANSFVSEPKPKVRGGSTESVTLTKGSDTTVLPSRDWFYSSREEIEKQGIEAATKAVTDEDRQAAESHTAELLADWDRQQKACKRAVPKAVRTAQRESQRALTAWTKAEQAIVHYHPASVVEAVELLTLAGRDPTRVKGLPRIDIGEVDYRTIVHNCSTVLQEALSGEFASASAPTSPLEMIDERVHPISSDPDLKAELDRLTREQDVGGLIALFDMYVAAAEAIISIENQPRSGDTDFMEAERSRLWSKAYAVATRLRTLRPTSYDREGFVQTLFNCALHMGNNLEESIEVMNAACAVPIRADEA
jgi:hypothetical protein